MLHSVIQIKTYCSKVSRWQNQIPYILTINELSHLTLVIKPYGKGEYRFKDITNIPGVLISFLQFFVVRKHIILKGNSFFVYTKYWPSDSTHFAHLPGKL